MPKTRLGISNRYLDGKQGYDLVMTDSPTTEKFQRQELQYEFPYHYIPHFDAEGYPTRFRILNWGLEYLCYQLHIATLVEKCHPTSILDVGCGDGRFLGLLSDAIPRRVGVDLSDKAISYAKAFHPNVDYRCADIKDLDENFDVVTCIEVLEHIPEEQLCSFVQNLFGRCNSGGKLIISVPTKILPVNKKHYRHYDLTLLLEQFNSANEKYEIEKIEYVFHSPKWMNILLTLTNNKFFVFEPHFLGKRIWKAVWNKYRIATERDGHHLVVCLRKV